MRKKRFTLLIVDDNNFFVDRIICLLKETRTIGKVITAYNYNEAVTCLKQQTPDIILLDINLPDKNGMELLKEIREAAIKTFVIMITNHDNEFYRAQCKNLGADYFLDKSGDFGKLPSIINELNAD
jgi:DNA-binding NarL/FixJ family response regulator